MNLYNIITNAVKNNCNKYCVVLSINIIHLACLLNKWSTK